TPRTMATRQRPIPAPASPAPAVALARRPPARPIDAAMTSAHGLHTIRHPVRPALARSYANDRRFVSPPILPVPRVRRSCVAIRGSWPATRADQEAAPPSARPRNPVPGRNVDDSPWATHATTPPAFHA